MTKLTRYLQKALFVFITGGLIPMASTDTFAQVTPQSIANTASAQWDVGAQRISVSSNTVVLTVDPAPVPASISLFRLTQSAGSVVQALPQTMCTGTAGRIPMTIGGAFADTHLAAANLLPTKTIRAGEPLVITINTASRNLNPAAIDIFDALIATSNGDSERISFTEDATNSGLFTGY
ncbi:MAG: hypothetical protein B7Y00_08235, partial [Sphingomonadales bacterium 17-56-6]